MKMEFTLKLNSIKDSRKGLWLGIDAFIVASSIYHEHTTELDLLRPIRKYIQVRKEVNKSDKESS